MRRVAEWQSDADNAAVEAADAARGYAQARKELAAAQDDVVRARDNLQSASRDLDSAKTTLQVAKAEFAAAKEELRRVNADRDASEAERVSARASVESAAAGVAEAERDLSECQRRFSDAEQRLREAERRESDTERQFAGAERTADHARDSLEELHSSAQVELDRAKAVRTSAGPDRFVPFFNQIRGIREDETRFFRGVVEQIEGAIADLASAVESANRHHSAARKISGSSVSEGIGALGSAGLLSPPPLPGVGRLGEPSPLAPLPLVGMGVVGDRRPLGFGTAPLSFGTPVSHLAFGTVPVGLGYPQLVTLPGYTARLASPSSIDLSLWPRPLGFGTPPTISLQLSTPAGGWSDSALPSNLRLSSRALPNESPGGLTQPSNLDWSIPGLASPCVDIPFAHTSDRSPAFNSNIEVAPIVSQWAGGAVFQGAGHSHFTFSTGGGWHVTTELPGGYSERMDIKDFGFGDNFGNIDGASYGLALGS
ncbi:MAG: hypothetical protein WCI73_04010 [Phycisphaerae bacterium]